MYFLWLWFVVSMICLGVGLFFGLLDLLWNGPGDARGRWDEDE